MILDNDGDTSVVYFRYFLTKKAPVPCMKQGLPDGHDSHGIAYCDISQYAIPEEKPGTYGLDIRLRIVLGIGPSPSSRYATYTT